MYKNIITKLSIKFLIFIFFPGIINLLISIPIEKIEKNVICSNLFKYSLFK